MTREQLEHAARLHGQPVGVMAWVLDPQRPGECGWLGGCHEVVEGHEGMCAAHSALNQPAVASDPEDPNAPKDGA